MGPGQFLKLGYGTWLIADHDVSFQGGCKPCDVQSQRDYENLIHIITNT